jgi:hypothetical protein
MFRLDGPQGIPTGRESQRIANRTIIRDSGRTPYEERRLLVFAVSQMGNLSRTRARRVMIASAHAPDPQDAGS